MVSQTKRLLVVEDDIDLVELLELHLKDAGFDVSSAQSGEEALRLVEKGSFDLMLLDVMLPDADGFDICRQVRQMVHYLPVVMVTSKRDDIDKILGLELGADDYITKPFNVREVVARVRAVLRRIGSSELKEETDKILTHGPLVIDYERRKVLLDAKTIELTTIEFDLLAFLASHPGRPFTRDELLYAVWGYQYSGYEHTVNSHINRLRGKIEEDPSKPRFILTVWGRGYRFAETLDIVPK